MTGANCGMLQNAHPLSTERIKELEKEVLENKQTFTYLDESGELCFAMPHGVEAIKELAWHNAYEITDCGSSLLKKHYKKRNQDSFELIAFLQKQPTEDQWSEIEGSAQETLILAETTYNGFVYEDVYDMCSITSVYPAQFVLQAGHTYKIIWDGVEYIRIAWQAEYEGLANSAMVCLGCLPGVGASNTGEPFGMNYVPYLNNNNIFAATEGSHTVAIYELTKTAQPDGTKIILAEQAVSGFTTGSAVAAIQDQLVSSKKYKVVWDGTEYTCPAYEAITYLDDGDYIIMNFIGNEAFVKWYIAGGDGEMPPAVEPFAMNMSPLGETGGALMVNMMCGAQFFGTCSSDTHTVAIYEIS